MFSAYTAVPRDSARDQHAESHALGDISSLASAAHSTSNVSVQAAHGVHGESPVDFAAQVNGVDGFNASPQQAGPSKPMAPTRWGVGRRQPMLMFLFYLAAVVVCVGNHLYHNYQAGRNAGSADVQARRTFISNIFVLAASICLTSATGIAFAQYARNVVRKQSLTVAGANQVLAITGDPTAFASLELARKAKIVLLFAFCMWMMPWTGIVPPGTLTSTPSAALEPTTATLTVRTLSINSAKNMLKDIFFRNGDGGLIRATVQPNPELIRIASTVALTGQLSYAPVAEANASYRLQFHGPAVECLPASTGEGGQQAAFDRYNSKVRELTRTFNVPEYQKARRAGQFQLQPPNLLQLYSAFSPTLYSYVNDEVSAGNDVDTYGNWLASTGIDGSAAKSAGYSILVQTADTSLVCTLMNATYDVGVAYVNAVPAVTQNSIRYMYAPNSTSQAAGNAWNPAYTAHLAALGAVLYGNLSMLARSCDGSASTTTTASSSSAASSNSAASRQCFAVARQSSKILISQLVDCDDFADSWWQRNADSLAPGGHRRLPFTRTFGPGAYNRCRNRTLAAAIADLSRNLTISMLSVSTQSGLPLSTQLFQQQVPGETALLDVTVPVAVAARLTPAVSVYVYDPRPLWISYGCALGAALVMVLVGAASFWEDDGVGSSRAGGQQKRL